MREWFPKATRLHQDELAVLSVRLSHQKVKDALQFRTSCRVCQCCNLLGNSERRPGNTKWPSPLAVSMDYPLVLATVNI